jgi:hypothetical protein
MFNTSPIKSKVMKVITARLDQADKEYRDECMVIDQQAEVAKTTLADKMVNDILGKIL